MNHKIVADEGLLAKVRGGPGTKFLCDALGEPVAIVLSPDDYKNLVLAGPDRRFDPELAEEAWQDYQQNGGCTTAEVLDYLKTLDRALDGSS
jgi:hypothetical protein